MDGFALKPFDEATIALLDETGVTIELSCDGPIREPYIGYMQGGLTYESGKLGVMMAVDEMLS